MEKNSKQKQNCCPLCEAKERTIQIQQTIMRSMEERLLLKQGRIDTLREIIKHQEKREIIKHPEKNNWQIYPQSTN